MKKLALLLICAVTLYSCDLDDDGPNIGFQLAEITEINGPEFFEAGETYDLDVTYELPTACHLFTEFRFEQEDVDSKEYFLFAVTSHDINVTECTEEQEDLSEERTIRDITIDPLVEDDQVYTFNYWVGEDEDGDNIYETVTIPVGDPDEEEDEDEDDNNEEEEEEEDEN